MSRRNKQRRKRPQPDERTSTGRLPQGALGGAAAAVAAAPLAGVPNLAVDMAEPPAPPPIVAAQAVSEDSAESAEPPGHAAQRRLIDDLDLSMAIEPREEFSLLELDFFRRAELLYTQGPVENFDDLEPSRERS